jgi:hypothetical protein
MCISVLCALLHAQIEGEFSLYLVRLMISFKFMLCSLTPWRTSNEDEWFHRNEDEFLLTIEEDKFLFEMSSLSKAKIKIHDYNEDHAT